MGLDLSLGLARKIFPIFFLEWNLNPFFVGLTQIQATSLVVEVMEFQEEKMKRVPLIFDETLLRVEIQAQMLEKAAA